MWGRYMNEYVCVCKSEYLLSKSDSTKSANIYKDNYKLKIRSLILTVDTKKRLLTLPFLR